MPDFVGVDPIPKTYIIKYHQTVLALSGRDI